MTSTKNRLKSRTSARAMMEALETRTMFSLLGIGDELGLPATSIAGPSPAGSVVTYSASTHAFSVTGVPISMILPSSTAQVNAPSSFTITITVDNSGNASSGASPTSDVVMTGDVTIGSNHYTGTLLTGQLEGFGFQAGTGGGTGVDNFDFQFHVTGGQLAGPYFTGSDIGVTLSDENSNFVDFTSNFSASPVKGYIGTVPPSGNPPPVPVSISGFKFQDQTGNGLTADDMTHPMAGVTIQLYLDSNNDGIAQPGELVASQQTTANGAYAFNNLAAGNYIVKEVIPSGYVETAPATGQYVVNATAGAYNNLNFDNYKCTCGCGCSCGGGKTLTQATSTLEGAVFSDCNNNGKQDYNESGISGVKITLTGTDLLGNSVSRTTTTDKNGHYAFSNLIAGTYSITETQPNGYTDGVDRVGTLGGTLGNDTITNITVPPCADGTCYNFGELKTTQVCGNTGHGCCNVTISGCDDHGRRVCYTTTTDCWGNYNFCNIRGGCYTVTECDSRGRTTGYGKSCSISWSDRDCSFSFCGFSSCVSNNNGANWGWC